MPKAKPKPAKPATKPATTETPTGPETSCKKCGSTERIDLSTEEREIRTQVKGRPITHAIWRRSVCANCGQHRRELFHENRDAATGVRS